MYDSLREINRLFVPFGINTHYYGKLSVIDILYVSRIIYAIPSIALVSATEITLIVLRELMPLVACHRIYE
jgi:ABC-type sulfate transport system permease subunit